MIYKPDQDAMKALNRLASNQDFKKVLLWIADCRDRTYEDMSNIPEEFRMRWYQGAAQDLDEILKTAEISKRIR
jgi:hypothetical protein